jgi:type IV pilus assembly protein PilV
MLRLPPKNPRYSHGTTMVELLVTLVILAFGLLGLAGLQAKVQAASIESYQRAQAIILLDDMANRIAVNRDLAASYASAANTLGTSHTDADDCTTAATVPARDLCEWSKALKGDGEKLNDQSVGAMVNARGCITEVQAPSTTTGACKPGVYMVTIAWQGVHATTAPGSTCGKDQYGADTYRRAISKRVAAGTLNCS